MSEQVKAYVAGRPDTAAATRQLIDAALCSAITATPTLAASVVAGMHQRLSACQQDAVSLLTILQPVRNAAFAAAGREREMLQRWRAAIGTAAAAWQLAPQVNVSAADAALAGLLHRVGAARVLSVIAECETALQWRLHASLLRPLEAAHEDALCDALLRAWEVTPVVAVAVREWRSSVGEGAGNSLAHTVYLAQLLANEFLQPQFHGPGVVDGVARQFKISSASLLAARRAISALG